MVMFCFACVLLPRGSRNKIWKAARNANVMYSPTGFRNVCRGRTARPFATSQIVLASEMQEKETSSRKVTATGGIRIPVTLADFERHLFRKLERMGFKKSNTVFWSVVFSCISAGFFYFYLYPYKLRRQVVEEVSSVASQSLEDEKIVSKAGQLSRDVLSSVLNDSATKVMVSDFVKDVIASEAIRDVVIGTILDLLSDPKVAELLRKRMSQIILDILQDDATRQIVLSQMNSILKHESVRESLRNLLSELTKTPEIKLLMSKFFSEVLASDTVKNQGKILGEQVTAGVISNKEIQEKAGNAIWSALKFSVLPNMFKTKEEEVTENEKKATDNAEKLSPLPKEALTKQELKELQESMDFDRFKRCAMDDDM